MIRNYTRPQTEIYQVLETTANPLLDRIHAVVVGPAFVHADVDAGNLNYVVYQQDDQLSYTLTSGGDVITNSVLNPVDQENVQVIVKDVRFQIFSDNPDFSALSSDPFGNILIYGEGSFYDTEDPSEADLFNDGRIPTPGDIYRLSDGTVTVERKVVGILGQNVDAESGSVTYTGAADWTNSSDNVEIALTTTNIDDVYVGDFSVVAFDSESSAHLYLQNFGKPGLGESGGLRLNFGITCTSGNGTVAGSTFQGTINGKPIALTAVTSGSADTKLKFEVYGGSFIEIILAGYRAWQTSDRIVLDIDFDIDVASAIFDDTLSLVDYTYEDAVKRVPSNLIVEVISVPYYFLATARVYDTAGLMAPQVIGLFSGTEQIFDLTYDGAPIQISVTIAGATRFHVGQKYSIQVTPPRRSTTRFDKVVLNAPIGSLIGSAFDTTAYVLYTGVLPAVEPILGSTNYEVGATSVQLNTLATSISGYPSSGDSVKNAVDGTGKIAVLWRSFITAGDNEGLVAIDSVTDITDNFGSIGLGSELGYGLYKAFSGSQGKRVYALNTGGTSLEAFQTAFEKLESATDIYTIAILTEDEEVMKLGASHAATLSAPTVKKFRRCYVGTDSPGQYPIIDVQDNEADYTASVEQGPGGLYNLVTFAQEIDLGAVTISKGDFVSIGGGEQFAIEEVNSVPLVGGGETIAITLQGDYGSPVISAPAKVIAADTAYNTARFVWERSGRLGSNNEQDRRIANIWQDRGNLSGKTIPNRFGACEIAGIRTALQPQQGLTRTEVSYIDSTPSMYTKFKPSLLDQMAANGVWIIAQNSAEGPVYVRHQLTTAVSEDLGSLYYEDNAGVNVDSICFALDDIIDPLIGKRNANPSTVVEIKTKTIQLLSDLTKTALGSLIGPQIIEFYNANGEAGTVDVAIDPNFKDRINELAVVEIPLPLNNVRITVNARTIKNDGVFVNAITVSTTA
jgi:hypothetical protein